MRNFIRSHTLLLSLTLCLLAVLILWALETRSCLLIEVEEMTVEAGCLGGDKHKL